MRLYVGFTDLPVVGPDAVHLTSATVTGVPTGLTIVKTGAVSVAETSKAAGASDHYIGALTEDMLAQGYPNLHIHPVSDAVLRSSGPVEWYLVIVVTATRSGDFSTGGLHIAYRTDGGESRAVDYPYRIHIHTRP